MVKRIIENTHNFSKMDMYFETEGVTNFIWINPKI